MVCMKSAKDNVAAPLLRNLDLPDVLLALDVYRMAAEYAALQLAFTYLYRKNDVLVWRQLRYDDSL